MDASVDKDKNMRVDRRSDSENRKDSNPAEESNVKCSNNGMRDAARKEILLTRRKKFRITDMTQEINAKCIEIWYKNISNDKSFPDEAQDLLKKFLARLIWKISLMDKVKLTNKLANVLLLHLKEYRRYVYIDRKLSP